MSILTLADIHFAYADRPPALGGVDLRIDAGEFVCICGPNGGGKSTLLRIAAGMLGATRGERRCFGADTVDARRVAFLPQSVQATYRHAVEEVVRLGREPHRASPWSALSSVDEEAIAVAMHQAEVEELVGREFDSLSGGEQQRVLLAAALAQGGELLLLDEPTAALDLHHQIAVFAVLRSLADGGRAVLCATHDLNFAAAADRVVLLAQGEVIAAGRPEDVLVKRHIVSVYGEGIWVGPSPAGGAVAVLPSHGVGRTT